MRRSVAALACAAAQLVALAAPSPAAPSNGQLAAVVDERLVTLNPDGGGLRTLWTPAAGGDRLSGLAWSPEGNRLAFVLAGRIMVFDLGAGRVTAITDPPAGAADANPGWGPDGARIGFRRVAATQRAVTVAIDGSDPRSALLDPATTDFAWAPDLTRSAVVAGPLLLLGGPALELSVTGTPAWSPDGGRIAFAAAGGLSTVPSGGGAATPVTAGPAGPPRWSPDGGSLVYATGSELRTVAAGGGAPAVVLRAASVGAADWQPCTPGVTASCESVAPPRCTASTAAATTQAGQPIDLPGAPCTDPAGRALALVLLKAPDHGTLAGWRYTPAPGFTGRDVVDYRVSNGVAESEPVRLTIFVVPRPAPAPGVRPPARRAPFLSAQATPRLDARRRTLVRLSCDQACSLALRLTARLRSRRTVSGPVVTRRAAALSVFSLRLRLPAEPRSRPKTVWIIGTVRNPSGDARAVKLPVTLPR